MYYYRTAGARPTEGKNPMDDLLKDTIKIIEQKGRLRPMAIAPEPERIIGMKRCDRIFRAILS